ncbi:MAG: 50S ribosomal protein L22 [Ignavibacteria bacterium]|nr:50S ribosomal protein L22 [Ignavibacteria bacterium]
MEARAINRYVGTSPRKMRLVIDLIRGMDVEHALTVLHFSPKHAARTAELVLRSAISNLQNKDDSGRIDSANVYVKEAYVNGGPVVKRISPAPMGRAYRIRKRSNHITIVVAQRETPAEKAQPKSKAKAAEAVAEPPVEKAKRAPKASKAAPKTKKTTTRKKKASSSR